MSDVAGTIRASNVKHVGAMALRLVLKVEEMEPNETEILGALIHARGVLDSRIELAKKTLNERKDG